VSNEINISEEEKDWGEAKTLRVNIGVDIITEMNNADEFPTANVYRLSKTMMEYFREEGHIDDLLDRGYSWTPTEDYWRRHLYEVRKILRNENGLYLEFLRDNIEGAFKGSWKILKKQEFVSLMEKESAGLEKRAETFNERLIDSSKKWDMKAVPGIHMNKVLIG